MLSITIGKKAFIDWQGIGWRYSSIRPGQPQSLCLNMQGQRSQWLKMDSLDRWSQDAFNSVRKEQPKGSKQCPKDTIVSSIWAGVIFWRYDGRRTAHSKPNIEFMKQPKLYHLPFMATWHEQTQTCTQTWTLEQRALKVFFLKNHRIKFNKLCGVWILFTSVGDAQI